MTRQGKGTPIRHDVAVSGPARSGRRPGRPDTRQSILDAARRLFAELGYDRTTVRGIADAAGVDSRLVTHYFGSKQRLFVAAAEPPVDPGQVLPGLLGSGADPAEALAGFIATLLDDPGYQRLATGLVRAASSEPEAASMARAFLTEWALGPVAREIGADQPELRASLLASQIVGLVFTRHIIRIEPLASLGHDDLAAALVPVVRHYLLEPLGP
jgi:AcrR family transcriptional regulator